MQGKRLLLVVSILTATVVGTALADIHPVRIDGAEPRLAVLRDDPDVMEFRVTVGEIVGLDVETEEGTFTRLFIPGFHSSQTIGAPELPMMNRLVEIPYGANVRVEVISEQTRRINLADYGITNRLMPAQPSMPKNVAPEDWPFLYDRDAYLVDRVGQELVRVQEAGRLRAVDIGRVEVSPVEYLPRTNELIVHDQIEFRVVFEGADHAAGDALKAATYSPFFEPLYDRIGGYDALRHDTHPDVVDDVVTYVIITPAAYVSTLQGFIDWKRECGYIVVVGEIGSPPVGTTTTSIQSYIHDLYNNPPAGQPAPSFVLFIGDVADCPTFSEAGDATDRPYCDVEGDLVPDIYYGRFSATSASELQDIVDKTLMYDQFTMPDPSYLSEVTLIAGVDSYWAPTHGNGQLNYGTTHYFNAAHGITSNTWLYPASDDPSAPAAIVQTVSDGVGLINYTAHGSETSWSDPTFTQSNVNGLTNSGKYCLAIGNCCLTSTYDYSECFGETWLRAADKGAIGYIGGSNSTYWDEDYWWGVGFHPASEINGTAYPYEDTGLGAYDGIFHDHGEAMKNWYITNDAIIFSGNLAVMESGSSRITYYWNIYNLLGDPSLSTYLGVPDTNPVSHPATIFTTSTDVTVDAAINSYIGLTQGGTLLAAGTVDSTGSATLDILSMPTPGTAHLVVKAQNMEPYITDINVIVPAVITIDPDTIQADSDTLVVVSVFEADGITPIPGVDVWAEGLGYETTPEQTDVAGLCTLQVNYPYGPSLDIVGQEPGESYELFREAITVLALPLTDPDLWVTTEIGLSDTFALNLPGVLRSTVVQDPAHLWLQIPDTLEYNTVEDSMLITPAELGEVTGIIAVQGYDLYHERFPVIEAYGTLTGHVDAGGSPAVGAVVEGYNLLSVLLWSATADGSGDYDVGEDILVAPYTVMVDFFGYEHWEDSVFINYGPNVLDINLTAAPSGVLTGTVKDSETNDPLDATIKVYRSDTMELYTQTTSDSAAGGAFTTATLPYFEYVVVIRAWHHKPLTINITIAAPTVEKHFVLEPTAGDLLVLDDGAAKGLAPDKVDEKTGEVLAPGYWRDGGKAAADIVADLEYLGFSATLQDADTSNALTWTDYDLLVVSSGNNTTTLASATLRDNLVAFVQGGGHLLIEGGEVGFDHYSSDPDFAQTVLHILSWAHDRSGNITVADPTHYVMSVPNTITGVDSLYYSGFGDQDAVNPTSDAVMTGAWTSYPDNASIVAYDPNPAPEGGQIVFYTFNYSSMDTVARIPLLENTITWLTTPEVGDGSVTGHAYLGNPGCPDNTGILVEATPGGGSMVTGANGWYEFTGLYAGDYTITASKDGWSTEIEEIALTEGQHMTDVDLVLLPIVSEEFCASPALAIPDNTPAGVRDTIDVALGSNVSGIEVFVDITHTYSGDLIVELVSPTGTTVVLHNRSGGAVDDIYGWYPSELTPAGDLADFLGETTDGGWVLHVSDNAGSDIGTLNSWCVNIIYSTTTGVAASDGKLPKVLALRGNTPNPFNPQTTIRFDLPKPGDVNLSIYEISGRRVATLVSGSLPAGYHEAVWMGLDESGRSVASGIYFYRLEAENEVLTRKMILLR